MGKGSLWRVEQQYKQNLIIALTRSSYHPNTAAMEKVAASYKSTPRSSESPPPVKVCFHYYEHKIRFLMMLTNLFFLNILAIKCTSIGCRTISTFIKIYGKCKWQ